MEEIVRPLIILAVVLAMVFGLLYVVTELLRFATLARDAQLVDDLIDANKARWRTDHHGRPMDRADWRRINLVGERRWQELLKAQRRTRTPSEPVDVVVFRGRGR